MNRNHRIAASCAGTVMTRTDRRAFFGRRKGHSLKPRQAALFDTLLPRARARSRQARARRPAHAVCRPVERAARDRLRRRRASDRAGASQSAHGLHRHARRSSTRMAKALVAIDDTHADNIRLYFGDASELLDWLPATLRSRASTCFIPIRGRSGGTGSAASSRTTTCARLARILQTRRRIALRHRHRRLRRLRARARLALAGFRLDRRMRRRLAQAVAGFCAARATRPRPSAKAACRRISFSAGMTIRRCPAAPARSGPRVARSSTVSRSKFSRATSSACGDGFAPGRALRIAFTVGQPNPAARARIRTGSARSPFISRSTTSTGTAHIVASAAMVSSYFPALANSAISASPSLCCLCSARTAASAAA